MNTVSNKSQALTRLLNIWNGDSSYSKSNGQEFWLTGRAGEVEIYTSPNDDDTMDISIGDKIFPCNMDVSVERLLEVSHELVMDWI